MSLKMVKDKVIPAFIRYNKRKVENLILKEVIVMILKVIKGIFHILFFILFFYACNGGSSTGPSSNVLCGDSPFSMTINGPSTIAAGNNINLSISVNQVAGLVSAPFYLVYDPVHVNFVSALEGDFLKQDGAPTVFIFSNNSSIGQVIIGNSRLGDTVGVSGSGVVMSATFSAISLGQADFNIENASLFVGNTEVQPSQICAASVEII